MKEQKNGSKLFLTELMIAIFFFSLVAAVCIQLFSDAHVMSGKSEELVQAVNVTSNAAEYYLAGDGESQNWEQVFPEGNWQGENWQVVFDENWNPISENGTYIMTIEFSEKEETKLADIAVSKNDTADVIYQLQVERVK